MPHEECRVVSERVCDPPTYHAPKPGYSPYQPPCRLVDRRVCTNTYIDKCVKTPHQKCSPGEPIR